MSINPTTGEYTYYPNKDVAGNDSFEVLVNDGTDSIIININVHLYVRGDSMYPLLKSGDIVLYKEIPNGVQSILWGEMYLLSFTLDGEDYITIKYIQKGDDERTVRLVSHNPHHSPKDIPADSIRALALVKASVRFNTMG